MKGITKIESSIFKKTQQVNYFQEVSSKTDFKWNKKKD